MADIGGLIFCLRLVVGGIVYLINYDNLVRELSENLFYHNHDK